MKVWRNEESTTLLVVAAIIVGGAVTGLLLGHWRADANPEVNSAAPPPPVAAPAAVPIAAVAASPGSSSPAMVPAVQPLSEDDLTGLANDSMSGPVASRLAAIERLAKAPREQALPLLERVLLNGEPSVDRPAALLALREIAVSQGDADQRVRDVVRQAIYHGDDDVLANQAQETLAVIDRAWP